MFLTVSSLLILPFALLLAAIAIAPLSAPDWWSRHYGKISFLFGAMTYIGNNPNFMIKAIAGQQKIRVPGFLGFIFKFALPFLVPALLLISWLFFKKQGG